MESTALGFLGGFTGGYIKDVLTQEGIASDFIEVKEDTRVNVKISTSKETDINSAGPEITTDKFGELLDKIKVLTAGDYLILSGNVQKCLPKDAYAQIEEIAIHKGVCVIVDTTGEALIESLKYKPFLIKPNNKELGEIFSKDLESRKEIVKYAQRLKEMGAQNVIISMAGCGALLLCDEGMFYAAAAKGVLVNSVGAGDSLVAGFMARYSQNKDIIDAFRYGVAAGSATAFTKDLCEKQDADHLHEQITLVRI